MADITVKDLKPAGAEFFFDDPESFITEIGSEDIGNVHGGGNDLSVVCDSVVCNSVLICKY